MPKGILVFQRLLPQIVVGGGGGGGGGGTSMRHVRSDAQTNFLGKRVGPVAQFEFGTISAWINPSFHNDSITTHRV